MIAWAAVDILGGRAVRLREGRREDLEDYGPADEAVARWADLGLRHIHLVDLSAAFGQPPRLGPLVTRALERAPGLILQVAGGIRSVEAAWDILERGASRVVLGTLIFSDPAAAGRALRDLGTSRCVAALDARDGRVRASGWLSDTGLSLAEAAVRIRGMGFTEALVTDIARDGMLEGPNLDLYRGLGASGLSIIASGGIRSTGDIEAVAAISGVSGAIVGKALYEGLITPREMKGEMITTEARREWGGPIP